MPRFGGGGDGGGSGPRFGRNFSVGEKITGFGLSALESFPELFGIEPTKGTQVYRAANPVGGFASQAVGAFVPYLGAARLARAAPLTGRLIRGAEGLGGNSIQRFALGAAAEAAVVETGRIGLSLSGAPEALYTSVTGRDPETRSASDLLLEGAFNIGAGGLAGAGIGAIAGRIARKTPFANIKGLERTDTSQPLPVRISALNDYLRKAQDPLDPFEAPPEILERVNIERNSLIRMNLEGAIPATSDNGMSMRSGRYRAQDGKAFRPLVAERRNKGQGEVSNFFNRLNGSRGGNGLTRTMRLIVGERGFESEAALNEALNGAGTAREVIAMEATDAFVLRVSPGIGRKPSSRSGLPPAANPGARLLSTPPDRAATNNLTRAQSIQKRMSSGKAVAKIGNGWNLFAEAGDDGLFVLTKKVKGGLEPAEGDEWMVLRTANPGTFDPQSAKMQKAMLDSAYFPEPQAGTKIGVAAWDGIVDMSELIDKNIASTVGKVMPGGRAGAAVKELGDLFGDKMAPSAPGATRHPIANALMQKIAGTQALVKTRTTLLMHGERFLVPGKTLARQTMNFTESASLGWADEIESWTPAQLEDWLDFMHMQVPVEQLDEAVSLGVLDPAVAGQLKAQWKYGSEHFDDLAKLNEVVQSGGASNITKEAMARKGHYAISWERPGAFRQFLVDDAGEIVGETDASDPIELATRVGEVIADQLKRKGKQLYAGPFFDMTQRSPEDLLKYKTALKRPGYLKARGNLLGTSLQGKTISAKDAVALLEKNVRRREMAIANISLAEALAPQMAKLARQAPHMKQFVQDRLDVLNGDEGDFAKAVNQIADKTLAVIGLSGKDSASEIVAATQKILSEFQFGFANVVNPLQDLMSITQTILPEISFAARISDASAHNYVSFGVYDSANNITGSINMLSDVKMLGSVMKNLFTDPDHLPPELTELLVRMGREGQLAPRVAEEQFGFDNRLLADPMKALREGKFVDFLGSLNKVMLVKSAEMSRTAAVLGAYEVAKIRGIHLDGDRLAMMTREFMSKTMYNYATADRARVSVGPVGSLAGTFKNWMFHYVASMIKYGTGGKESMPAFLWQTASTAMIGGAAATPFLVPVADGLSKFMLDKPLLESFYGAFGEKNEQMADGLMYGLPAMFGASLASYSASPGSDPERDATMMFSIVGSDRMRSLGGGVKDALTAYAATGESPFTDDNVRDQLARALAPRSIYRAMATAENGALRSMGTGYDVMKMGPGSALLYSMGFNPTELDKTYAVYSQVRESQTKKKELTQEFGRSLAQAWKRDDKQLANRIFARSMAMGIDSSAVLKSARARGERAEETQLEYTITPEQQAAYGFMFE